MSFFQLNPGAPIRCRGVAAIRRFALIAGAILAMPASAQAPSVASSRAIVDEFAAKLGEELQKSLAFIGPELTINVCADIAPQLASDLSRRYGARVSRTSLRFRNPANAPEPWQAAVLESFEAGSEREFFETLPDGSARYLRAIPTTGLCLACHGTNLAAPMRDKIATEYPHDRATGYSTGDIRGAFSIVWPAKP